MSLPPFSYHQPDSLGAVIEAAHKLGSEAALLAGGTALLIDLQHGELSPRHLISLWGIRELGSIRLNGSARIGALATMDALAKAAENRPELAGLREAALRVGSRQIQNVATVGGNICKASPGADLVPPLLCLDAQLSLSGPQGERLLPLDGFLTGPDRTALLPAEVLTAVHLTSAPDRSGTAFLKVMRRQAVDCSIVSVATRLTLDADRQRVLQARIAIAAAAPNPFRAKAAEQMLDGQRLNPSLASQAGQLAQQESNPIDDVRASAQYRRWLVESLVERALLVAARRAGAE